MALVPRAVWKVEVGWDQYVQGFFTFDVSTFDGPDLLQVSEWGAGFAGANDNITNPGDGSHVDAISIIRGREDDLSLARAGECTLEISDPKGKFNRKNPSSVLAGKLVPNRPIRVSAKYGGTTYGRFYGWIQSIEWESRGRSGVATIHACDFFCRLKPPGDVQGLKPLIASTGATTTGAAIGKILDYMDWRDAAMRSLAAGDALNDFSLDGTVNALDAIEALLAPERGLFYVAGNGAVTFKSRNQRQVAASLGTLANVMTNMRAGSDIQRIVNKWTVTRTGGVAQVATNTPSKQQYGEISAAIGPTPYLSGDTQALDLANYLLSRTKSPDTPLWDLPLRNKDAATLTHMLARELGDRITLTESKTPSTADYFIEQIREEVSMGGLDHSVAWRLTERLPGTPFVLDTSLLDGTDQITY